MHFQIGRTPLANKQIVLDWDSTAPGYFILFYFSLNSWARVCHWHQCLGLAWGLPKQQSRWHSPQVRASNKSFCQLAGNNLHIFPTTPNWLISRKSKLHSTESSRKPKCVNCITMGHCACEFTRRKHAISVWVKKAFIMRPVLWRPQSSQRRRNTIFSLGHTLV